MLTEKQRLAREGKITASAAKCLMDGDKEKILNLWRMLVGDPSYVEEDLSGVWAVQLGSLTESLNLDWYSRKTGRLLTKRGEVIVHPDYEWASCTLDAFDEAIPGPVETKHCGGYEKADAITERYYCQCQFQLEVTQTKQCALSIIYGSQEPRVEMIAYNKDYCDEMMARAHKLMVHVWDMTMPVELERVAPPVPRSLLKDYNMTGNNHWAAAAADWLKHKDAAKSWDKAVETIKGLVKNDAASATGYGIVARRDRANRISIKSINDKPGPKPKS